MITKLRFALPLCLLTAVFCARILIKLRLFPRLRDQLIAQLLGTSQ